MRFNHDIHKAIILKQLFLSVLLIFSINVFAEECKLDLKTRAEYEKATTYNVWYTQIMMDIEALNVHRIGLEGFDQKLTNAEYKKKVTSTAKHISDMLSSKDPCVQIFLNRDFLVYDKVAKTKENSIGYLMSRYLEEFGADIKK